MLLIAGWRGVAALDVKAISKGCLAFGSPRPSVKMRPSPRSALQIQPARSAGKDSCIASNGNKAAAEFDLSCRQRFGIAEY